VAAPDAALLRRVVEQSTARLAATAERV